MPSQTTARPLVIGLDARAAVEVPAGRGRFVRELLNSLADDPRGHRYLCYARQPWETPAGSRHEWRLIAAPDPLWHMQTARRASAECDVFLSTNSYLTVAMLSIPSATVVYDLVTFEREMRPNRRSMVIERLTLSTAVRRSDQLVCISRATAEALTRRFPQAAPKTSVALLAASSDASRPGAAELQDLPPPGFVLAVGTLEPRKNLPRLITAYAMLPPALQDDHPLVVVGPMGWQTGPTLKALSSLGERCRVMGRVSDAVLAELYARCGVFCYPSLGEGFGLPVLEAMAAGAAVVTSNTSSLPEVGGEAAEYVDPRSPESIAVGLEHVLTDGECREELRRRGRIRSREFSWERTAAAVVRALERAAAARPAT